MIHWPDLACKLGLGRIMHINARTCTSAHFHSKTAKGIRRSYPDYIALCLCTGMAAWMSNLLNVLSPHQPPPLLGFAQTTNSYARDNSIYDFIIIEHKIVPVISRLLYFLKRTVSNLIMDSEFLSQLGPGQSSSWMRSLNHQQLVWVIPKSYHNWCSW